MFQKKEKSNKKLYHSSIFKKRFVIVLLIFSFSFGAVFTPTHKANAIVDFNQAIKNILDPVWDMAKYVRDRAGSGIFRSVLSSAANKIAYDLGTYIGSGGEGQGAKFTGDNWEKYLTNIADEAAGQFIEDFAKSEDWDFNFCEPSFSLKYSIGLGLVDEKRESAPDCTFSEMANNWEEAVTEADFLPNLQNMFDPASNNMGVALKSHVEMREIIDQDIEWQTKIREETKGWFEFDNLAKVRNAPPEQSKTEKDQAADVLADSMSAKSDNILVDAVNIFINRAAITAFNNALRNIGGSRSSNTTISREMLGEYESDTSSGAGGVTDTREALSGIIEPDFSVTGDFEVLNGLSVCPDPTKPGVTECVITNKFSRAIQERLTLSEAVEQGYLNHNGSFGYMAEGPIKYNEGFPYRSMLILRKYRVIPVGWEVAAQYIRENQAVQSKCTLGDLMACHSAGDDFGSNFRSDPSSCVFNVSSDVNWCTGLVDPNWVLKAPLNYCGRSGYGPKKLFQDVVETGLGYNELIISRQDGYCADEQTCIKENDDGTCHIFGYCTEERRKWRFDGETCDSKFNTCQTFRSDQGKTVSYLENTLDYGGCSLGSIGCKWYCEDYEPYNVPTGYVGYWRFDEGFGTIANDSHPNSNDGDIIGNVTWEDGIVGKALMTDGASNGHVRIQDKSFAIADAVNSSGELTLMYWFKNNDLTQSNRYIFNKGGYVASAQLNSAVFSGRQILRWDGSTTGVNQEFDENNYQDTTNWTHFAFTIEAGGNATLYKNGAIFNSQIDTEGIDLGTADIYLFDYLGGGVGVPNGLLDEVAIYNRVVSGNDIKNYYDGAVSDQYNWTCTEVSGNKKYFDNNVQECKSEDEGCHEFIRTKPGLGTNLVWNASFEVDDDEDDQPDNWSANADPASGLVNGGLYGQKALSVVRRAANDSYDTGNLVNEGYFNDGDVLIGSAWFKADPGSYASIFLGDTLGTPNPHNNFVRSNCVEGNGDWQRITATHTMINSDQMSLFVYSGGSDSSGVACPGASGDVVLFDGAQVEISRYADDESSSFKNYRTTNVVYEKLAPDYLNCDGIDDPYECDNYATECSGDDVGCELFTSTSIDMNIPAKVSDTDYCSSECSGYDVYIQKDATFDSTRDEYFVPSLAKSCSSEVVGCDEFTNLDAIDDGGEGIGYYHNLKQCVLENDPNCRAFYTWEGSKEAGYQLKVYEYVQDDDTDDAPGATFDCNGNGYIAGTECIYSNDPAVTSDDSAACNEIIYNLPTTDPAYDSECIEYYNNAGEISYHLKSRTITCSDDCHPFRRTENNIDNNLTVATCVTGGDGTAQYNNTLAIQYNWDAGNSECNYCINGGYWDVSHSACIYNAIPSEGKTCSSADAGCREYTGNSGNNVKTIFSNNFEGSTQGWVGVGSTVALSSESLSVGGESLYVSDPGATPASTTVGQLVTENKSYVVSFIAKAEATPTDLSVSIRNGVNVASFSSAASLSLDWEYFEINLPQLDHPVTDTEALYISTLPNANYYIDNIKLIEIVDRFFLTKGSLSVPSACYVDIYGDPVGALYNLGCDGYLDRENNTHYLRQFSQLCSESVVGCELMIDTHNYSNYFGQTFHSADLSEAVIDGDSFVYAVYDADKQCSRNSKGCQYFGDYYDYVGYNLFDGVYLLNDPDSYDSILCYGNEDGCKEWESVDGVSYFKDPSGQVCEWRQKEGISAGSWKWYKKKIRRCDTDSDGAGDGDVCLGDDDCGILETCELEIDDYECPVSELKTFGKNGTTVNQPKKEGGINWTGLCTAEVAGCTEYLDPLSRFSENMLNNADFSVDSNGFGIADYWTVAVNGEQEIIIDTETAYIFSVEGPNEVKLEATNFNFTYVLNPLNNLVASTTIYLSAATNEKKSLIIYQGSTGNLKDEVIITALDATQGNGSVVGLKKAVIDYQLKQELDKITCNGLVNFEDGCVLFNERAQDGNNLASLLYDTNETINDGDGVVPRSNVNTDENDSTELIKVRPDRECDKWLACGEFERVSGIDYCNKVGVCNSFNDSEQCDDWVDIKRDSQTYDHFAGGGLGGVYIKNDIADLSGYVKIGSDNLPSAGSSYPTIDPSPIWYNPNDLWPLATTTTVGQVSTVPNGDFEDDTSSPDFWVADGTSGMAPEIVYDPSRAQELGACYSVLEGDVCDIFAPEGRSFLRLPGREWLGTQNRNPLGSAVYFRVRENTRYFISAFINTNLLSIGDATLTLYEMTDAQAVSYATSGTGGSPVNGTSPTLSLQRLQPWTMKIKEFITGPNTTQLRIRIGAAASGALSDLQGYSSFWDDIKIRPVLETRNDWDIPQSCRLYPKDDSLSCDYYDPTGIRYKGLVGYCLEHDVYPGDANACLQWWSIPNVTVTSTGLQEWCGDEYVNGDEDCDCGTDSSGNALLACNYNAIPGYVDPGAPPYSRYDQYQCINCKWAEGWCGDDAINASFPSPPYQVEECDHNEANNALGTSNVGGSSCTINSTGGAEWNHEGFTDFLWGILECQARCQFDTGPNGASSVADPNGPNGTCSDFLVNGSRTRRDCINAGGYVVDNTGQIAITDTLGNIVAPASLPTTNTNPGYFCRVPGGSCGGAMTQYLNWSETTYNTCETGDCWGILGIFFNPIGQIWDAFGNDEGCGTGQHAWANVAQETCSANRNCSWPTSDRNCSAIATITSIGCY